MSSVLSSSTSRSNLDYFFDSAPQAYKKRTGKDITSDPLATELQSCDSPDAILAVLRRQSISEWPRRIRKMPYSNRQRPIRVFRGPWRGCWFSDYHKVIINEHLRSNIRHSGLLATGSHFCWHWRSPLSQAPFHFVVQPILTRKILRQLRTSTPAKVFSLICSARLSTSSVDSKSTPRCLLLLP
jgi:hypothetical protein